jgi:hypothetical protein
VIPRGGRGRGTGGNRQLRRRDVDPQQRRHGGTGQFGGEVEDIDVRAVGQRAQPPAQDALPGRAQPLHAGRAQVAADRPAGLPVLAALLIEQQPLGAHGTRGRPGRAGREPVQRQPGQGLPVRVGFVHERDQDVADPGGPLYAGTTTHSGVTTSPRPSS